MQIDNFLYKFLIFTFWKAFHWYLIVFQTDLFFESIPDDYIDVKTEDWVWAENDEVVENAKQNIFCDRKNEVGKKNCDLVIIPDARHGILIESDEIRQPAIDFIEAYFKSFSI